MDRFDLNAKSKHVKPRPRLVLFGEPGIGKTTFASQAPKCILVPGEDGSLGVDMPRLPNKGKLESYEEAIKAAKVLRDKEHSYEWAAFDTINAIEHLCSHMVCHRDCNGVWNSKPGVEGFNAYGKGDKATAQELRELLSVCDELQQKKGMGIIFLAHVGLHRQGNALGADFYKFAGDLSKPAWAVVCSWADQVGFAARDVRAAVKPGETKAKASAIGAERWIYFEGGPGMDAKARIGYEMPSRILLSWEDYEAAMNSDRLGDLVIQANVLIEGSTSEAKDKIKKRLGSKINDGILRALGKGKLENMLNWLLTQQKERED